MNRVAARMVPADIYVVINLFLENLMLIPLAWTI